MLHSVQACIVLLSYTCIAMILLNLLIQGTKFLHKEDWGEMLVGKERPVICILDVTCGDVSVVEDDSLTDTSCGQVIISSHCGQPRSLLLPKKTIFTIFAGFHDAII